MLIAVTTTSPTFLNASVSRPASATTPCPSYLVTRYVDISLSRFPSPSLKPQKGR